MLDLILSVVDKWAHLLGNDVLDVGAVLSDSGEWELLSFNPLGHEELEASKRFADTLARDHSIEHLIGG